MRYRRLDLNLLVAMDVLLTEKSVTRAASRLNITQSAMSGVLARLREYFGDPLVVQVGRQMELTPLAQSLIGPVHDIMLRIDAAIATEPAFDPATSKRHFVFTASDYVLRVLLKDVLQALQREAPGVTFEFRQSSGRVQEELESGEVDFVIGPEIDVLAEHPQEVLFTDTYTVIAWNGNTAIGENLTFDEFMALGHVVFLSERHGMPSIERWLTKKYGDARRIEVSAPSFLVLPHLVVGTDRIATLQAKLARYFARELPLRLLAPPVEMPVLTEVLQWNSHRDGDLGFRWLRARLKAAVAAVESAPSG